MSKVQQAKVKSVLSGDTVILTAVSNPRSERTLSFAAVTAPRMRREGDESFAVESRDFIRRLLVGKVIQFRVFYSLPTGTKREYGTITLQNGEQLPELSVAEGYLKLRDDAGKRGDENEDLNAMVEKLKVLEARAKADRKGVWSEATEKIETSYELSNAEEFSQRWKGKPIDSIVEKVLTGDRLIVRFMETPTRHVQGMLLIAGIRAPNTKRVNASDGSVQAGEPFGEEAHEFIETRLLQRRVNVTILGISPQNQLIGSVKHPNGDIALFILNEGLARCLDLHAPMLGQDISVLRQAEKSAKDKRLGVFKSMAAPRAGAAETDVVVSRVQSADTLFLRYPDGSERRVNLSSVRQPKPSDPKQAPFSADAKEFMRRRLIGKHVKVSIDGKRPASEGFDEREMVTILVNKENVALTLVENGYASVLRHRMDDTDRSPIYDELLIAEDQAQKDASGIWAPKAPEAKQYVDYSESLDKAKRLLSLLSRQKRVPAIVDFVKGGSRFTLLIPRENAKITFVLSGIQAPKSARNASETSEPFGREAHDLANRRLQQRDVEIDVEDNDKVGGFIGKLYVNRENFAKILLEEGFASVRLFSAEKSGNAAELTAAEQHAKDARKGLWEDYDPSQDEPEAAGDLPPGGEPNGAGAATANGDTGAVPQAPPSKDYRDVVVTHVEPNLRVRFQHVSPATTGALSSLMNALRGLNLSSAGANLSGPPKAGDVVAARFSEDGEWYRARVRRVDRAAKTAEVLYGDYGNSEALAWDELRTLPQPERFGVAAAGAAGGLAFQAAEAALSFVRFPAPEGQSAMYADEARAWLATRCCDGEKQLVARVDFKDERDGGLLWVSLFDPDAGEGQGASSGEQGKAALPPGFINGEAVEEGLAMAGRRPARWERAQGSVLEALRTKEAAAKEERLGMWEYGDLTED